MEMEAPKQKRAASERRAWGVGMCLVRCTGLRWGLCGGQLPFGYAAAKTGHGRQSISQKSEFFDRLKPRFLSESGAGMRNVERNRNLNFAQLATHFTVAGEAAEQFLLKTCVRIHGKYLLHKLGWGRGAEWWAALWCASGLRELTADAVEQLAVLRHHQKQILLHNIIPPKVLRIESIYLYFVWKPARNTGKLRQNQKRSARARFLPYSSIPWTRSCFTEYFFTAIPPYTEILNYD